MLQSAVPFLFIPFRTPRPLSLKHSGRDVSKVSEGSGLKSLGGTLGLGLYVCKGQRIFLKYIFHYFMDLLQLHYWPLNLDNRANTKRWQRPLSFWYPLFQESSKCVGKWVWESKQGVTVNVSGAEEKVSIEPVSLAAISNSLSGNKGCCFS